MRLFRLLRALRDRYYRARPYTKPFLTTNGDGVTRYTGDDTADSLRQLGIYLQDTYPHRFVYAIDRMHDRYYEFAPWIAANRTGAVYHWANERICMAGLYFASADDAFAFRMQFPKVESVPVNMTLDVMHQVMERCLEI